MQVLSISVNKDNSICVYILTLPIRRNVELFMIFISTKFGPVYKLCQCIMHFVTKPNIIKETIKYYFKTYIITASIII